MPLKVQPRAEKAKTGQKGVEMIVWDIKKKGGSFKRIHHLRKANRIVERGRKNPPLPHTPLKTPP